MGKQQSKMWGSSMLGATVLNRMFKVVSQEGDSGAKTWREERSARSRQKQQLKQKF